MCILPHATRRPLAKGNPLKTPQVFPDLPIAGRASCISPYVAAGGGSEHCARTFIHCESIRDCWLRGVPLRQPPFFLSFFLSFSLSFFVCSGQLRARIFIGLQCPALPWTRTGRSVGPSTPGLPLRPGSVWSLRPIFIGVDFRWTRVES